MTTLAMRRAIVVGLCAVATLLSSSCSDEQALESGSASGLGASAGSVVAPSPIPIEPAAGESRNRFGDGVAPIPALPSARQRVPELYDERGCVRTGPTGASCASTVSEHDLAASGSSADDWRRLAGFEGRWFTSDVSRGQVVVLESTIRSSESGPWQATGLVRNERDEDLGGVTVTAELFGGDGRVIRTVSADSPVTSVRAGEPVPFLLATDVDAAAVASVRWSAAASVSAAPPDPGAREVALATYWTRSPSSGRRVDLYLYRDEAGPLPYLLFGAVESVTSRTLRDPRVVVAWLDREGRVAGVSETRVVDTDGTPAAGLAPGASLDFLVRLDDSVVMVAAESSAPMLWGVAR